MRLEPTLSFEFVLEIVISDRYFGRSEHVRSGQHDDREKATLVAFMPIPCLVRIILGVTYAETQDLASNDLDLCCRALQYRWRWTSLHNANMFIKHIISAV